VSEQAVDLRSTLSILRRHRRILAAAALVGVLGGVAFVRLRPPLYSSTSLVLLPPPPQTSGGQSTRDVDTEIQIALSDVVLGPAGESVRPKLSMREVAQAVTIAAPTTDVLQVKASAEAPGRAEELSRAVANAEVTYLKEAASSLSNTQLAALAARQKQLESSLASVNNEIKKTSTRSVHEDPSSAAGKADASAIAQLTAQQADLVLQVDQLKKDQADGSQPQSGTTGSTANVIQDASPASRPGIFKRYVIFCFLGVAILVALTSMLLTVLTRRDRRLRSRDEIADALGSAVIASIRSRVPGAAAGWTSLLEGYAPGTVDTWALRQALRQLMFAETGFLPRASDPGDVKTNHPVSMTVIALSDDLRGVAMGPQIASYAASMGVRTRLLAVQGHDSAAALWAACGLVRGDDEVRPNLMVDTHPREQDDVDLTVALAVVDRRDPELAADLPKTSVTVLAVSAGSATAEDLALVAVTADEADMRIAGIVVADPDNLDRTTGRLLQHERFQQVSLPTRLTGPTASARSGNVSSLPRRPR
jgi:capsular polysaccharide biosynthesis protein